MTSSTSITIGTGSKGPFTVSISSSNSPLIIGDQIVIFDAGGTNLMVGKVTAYSGTALTLNVTATSGSGTIASWTIKILQLKLRSGVA